MPQKLTCALGAVLHTQESMKHWTNVHTNPALVLSVEVQDIAHLLKGIKSLLHNDKCFLSWIQSGHYLQMQKHHLRCATKILVYNKSCILLQQQQKIHILWMEQLQVLMLNQHQLPKWRKGSGQVLPRLVTCRNCEVTFFKTPLASMTAHPPTC